MSHYIPKRKEYASPEDMERELEQIEHSYKNGKRLAIDDQDLPDRVSHLIEQRDRFRELASEMVATLGLDRNAQFVSAELRELFGRVWKPAFDAALNGTELNDEQIDYALAAHCIDVEKAHKRIAALLAKHSE